MKAQPEGRKYGYARVSTTDQDLTIQIDALNAAGCITIFKEKKSGTKRQGREQLDILLKVLQAGDTMVITRVDRLGRSGKDLQDIVFDLKARGIHLKATEQPIDTSSATGKAFFDMMGVWAELETNLRYERQMEGIAKAKAEGKYKGRKPNLDGEKIKQLRSNGLGPAAIAKQLKIARSSVYRLLEEQQSIVD